jgi:hypothetical protein
MSSNTINKGLPPPAEVQPAERLHRHRERQDAADRVRRDAGHGLKDDDTSHGFSADMHERSSAFEQRLERGLKQHREDDEHHQEDDPAPEQVVVLTLPGPGPVAKAEGKAPDTLPKLSETMIQKVIAVSLQIEKALTVEGLPRWDAPMTVKLNAEGIADGLVGLTINSGPGMLDIVLERTVAGVTPALAAAAQALADRLQQRFPNRMIRIFDRLADRDRAASSAAATDGENATVADATVAALHEDGRS